MSAIAGWNRLLPTILSAENGLAVGDPACAWCFDGVGGGGVGEADRAQRVAGFAVVNQEGGGEHIAGPGEVYGRGLARRDRGDGPPALIQRGPRAPGGDH